MNRILIGSGNNEIEKINNDELTINIDFNANILIENSNIKKYIFNIKHASVNILSIRSEDKEKNYEINLFGGDVSFNNISFSSDNVKMDINLNKENSNILVCNSVISNKKINHDLKVNHNACMTNSDIYNNAITKDKGTVVFNVSSYVPKKSVNCRVNQDSKIITLNDENDNEINPVLLIDEYESEARHAAFIGNFNKDKLFYLMSRGLNKKEATNVLTNGLLVGKLDVCFNEKEKLKEKLNKEWR